MTIITPGKLKSETLRHCSCTSCGCHFTFKDKEARYQSDQRDGDALVVICPQQGCGTENWVPATLGTWNQVDR